MPTAARKCACPPPSQSGRREPAVAPGLVGQQTVAWPIHAQRRQNVLTTLIGWGHKPTTSGNTSMTASMRPADGRLACTAQPTVVPFL